MLWEKTVLLFLDLLEPLYSLDSMAQENQVQGEALVWDSSYTSSSLCMHHLPTGLRLSGYPTQEVASICY